MNNLIYGYCLCSALALMLFFGIYFLAARLPEKPIYENSRRSRMIMGAALLLLSVNYSIHLILRLRFSRPDIAICMDLSTYWEIIFGIGCELLTFLPEQFFYLWILSSIPFYYICSARI